MHGCERASERASAIATERKRAHARMMVQNPPKRAYPLSSTPCLEISVYDAVCDELIDLICGAVEVHKLDVDTHSLFKKDASDLCCVL